MNPNIDHYKRVPHSPCRNCKYRKEYYPIYLPRACKQCGLVGERNEPYYLEIPVWRDGYVPTKQEIRETWRR